MGVKDLVQLYEFRITSPTSSDSETPAHSANTPHQHQSSPNSKRSSHPRPPKFERHPLLTTHHETAHENDALDLHTLPDHDVTEELPMSEEEHSHLLPQTASEVPTINTTSLSTASSTRIDERQSSDSRSSYGHGFTQQHRTPEPHDSIPANQIFSRHAALLYLPKLDQYLEGLPALDICTIGRKESPIFPPMHLLDPSKRTLDDLETNSKASPWYDRKNILGAAVGVILGLTVSDLGGNRPHVSSPSTIM